MNSPVIHLLAVAGSCRALPRALGCKTPADVRRFVREAVGDRYHVRVDARLMNAAEHPDRGGRDDDVRRARDVERALGDDRVAAVVALRGGSWLTRILPLINFDVLKQRRTRVALFGFSELTTIINIAAGYTQAVCFYDLGPGFLRPAMRGYAYTNATRLSNRRWENDAGRQRFAARWAAQHFGDAFRCFFQDVVGIVEGRGSQRRLTGRIIAGTVPRAASSIVVGGNLAVMISLIGTPYAAAIDTANRWLAIEDVNEAPYRIDRLLAHLRLAGLLSRCAGILVGDFHDEKRNLRPVVLALLRRHLPSRCWTPVVTVERFGHVWPMAPLLIGRPLTIRRSAGGPGGDAVELVTPWSSLGTV